MTLWKKKFVPPFVSFHFLCHGRDLAFDQTVVQMIITIVVAVVVVLMNIMCSTCFQWMKIERRYLTTRYMTKHAIKMHS